jgi:hypothetical protein
MMNKFLIIIAILALSVEVSGQTETYISKNNDGYSSDWIKFFDNGRFELVHDEQCFAYINGAGVFKAKNDSIQLSFFKLMDSKKEVIEKENTDKKVDVTVHVFSLQDSSIINTATVFARDTTRQKYDLTETVDSNGMKIFTIPEGKTIKYIRVYADNYVDCEIVFEEKYDSDYSVKIYLSEDPLQKRDYKGLTDNKEVLIRKGKNKIVYRGMTYKKQNE